MIGSLATLPGASTLLSRPKNARSEKAYNHVVLHMSCKLPCYTMTSLTQIMADLSILFYSPSSAAAWASRIFRSALWMIAVRRSNELPW